MYFLGAPPIAAPTTLRPVLLPIVMVVLLATQARDGWMILRLPLIAFAGIAVEAIGTQRPLSYRQRSLVERFGLSVTALIAVDGAEIVQRRRNDQMVGAQRLFPDRQRPGFELLGFGIALLNHVEFTKIFQCCCNVRMIWTERFLPDCQRPLVKWLGFGVTAQIDQENGKIVQR